MEYKSWIETHELERNRELQHQLLPDCMQFFSRWATRPVRDKIQDSLQAVVIARSKSRALVDDKIRIILWNDLVNDI
jgi:hypothetical protein